jgi:hypothetical protein
MVATAPRSMMRRPPSAIRAARALAWLPMRTPLEIGKGRIVREGTKPSQSFPTARACRNACAPPTSWPQGLSTTVADARFAKPLDEALMRRLAREHEVLITIEEGARRRLRRVRAAFAGRTRPARQSLRIRTLTLPDIFQDHDKRRTRCTCRLASTPAGARAHSPSTIAGSRAHAPREIPARSRRRGESHARWLRRSARPMRLRLQEPGRSIHRETAARRSGLWLRC